MKEWPGSRVQRRIVDQALELCAELELLKGQMLEPAQRRMLRQLYEELQELLRANDVRDQWRRS
jgi:hypothetical protein